MYQVSFWLLRNNRTEFLPEQLITFSWNFPDHIERSVCVKSSKNQSAFAWKKKISTIPSQSYTDFQNFILEFEITGTTDWDPPQSLYFPE